MSNLFQKLQNAIDFLQPIDGDTALSILNIDNDDFPMLLGYANKLRVKTQGAGVRICTIMNAKSGACGEDCAFCSQSAHSKIKGEIYPMRDSETIAKIYDEAPKNAFCFGVVTSGEGLNDSDIDVLVEAMKRRGETSFAQNTAGDKEGEKCFAPTNERQSVGAKHLSPKMQQEHLPDWSASLGIITYEQLLKLKNSGMARYHHNIETAKSFYPQICTTHSWDLRSDMARRVKKMNLELCCGGIMGVGESKEQRVELAMELAEIGSDIIPLNFLIAQKGTKLENIPPIKPLDILKTVAMFRFVNPTADIKIAGGRVHLHELQSMMFFAGANSIISGGLLTTPNCTTENDKKLIADLELEICK